MGALDVQRLEIAEFRRLGYLQEINRRLLHPLGLALEVTIADDGTETISGVWDCRDDPEGVYFADVDDDLRAKAVLVEERWRERRDPRVAALGYMIQPLEGR
jgi:hypothetical protein